MRLFCDDADKYPAISPTLSLSSVANFLFSALFQDSDNGVGELFNARKREYYYYLGDLQGWVNFGEHRACKIVR